MKSQAKLTPLAAFAVKTLLLVLPLGAFAVTEADREIGVPQPKEASVNGCFGAVLSPDGDRFYSVQEGLLTQYQINPFKKIDSVAIDRAQLKEERQEPHCRVLITNDKTKLIIVFYDRMFLLDAKTAQILNKVGRTELARSFGAAVINDNDLVILETFHTENRYFFNLSLWDADTLKWKREIRDLGENLGFFLGETYGVMTTPKMTKILDRIYLVGDTRVVVLASRDYSPELLIQSYMPSGYGPKISNNFQKLYVWKVSKVTDHLTQKQKTFESLKDGDVLVFNQKTRESKIKDMKDIPKEEYAPWLTHTTQTSRSKKYVMASIGSHQASALLVHLETGNKRFGFRQYDSGEAILFGIDEPWFQLTPGARKYLMMKNSVGQIVPMNDATFHKYHRIVAK